MKIICIGDSHTYSFGIARSQIWTKVAGDILKEEIINKGISGDTSSGMLSRFNKDVVEEKAEIVHIMGGTNDFIMECDLGVVRANIMALVHQAIYNGIMPVIGIPIKISPKNVREDWARFTDFNEVARKVDEYRKWILKFCETFNVKYIDYYDILPRVSLEKGIYQLYFDGLHLTKEGNQLFGEIFAQEFKKLFINSTL